MNIYVARAYVKLKLQRFILFLCDLLGKQCSHCCIIHKHIVLHVFKYISYVINDIK